MDKSCVDAASHIHDYIEQDSPLYAKRVSDAMVHKTAKLDKLPTWDARWQS